MSNEIINIKGTRKGLVICLDSNRDFEELKNTLISKIEASQGFFRGAKFTFHLDRNTLSAEKTQELEEICCRNGLIIDHEITVPHSYITEIPKEKKPASLREKAMAANVRPLMREASPSIPSVGLTENDRRPCLFIQRSLRSGQKIKYDGNIVILGDVNPGSEVTASGDVIVMGTLRGVVHAGVGGNEEAVITAYRLNPVQLRIGSAISRPPENSRPGNYPETACLRDGQMVIEPYVTYGLKSNK